MNEVERDTPHYWEVIANEVATRDALQCQRFHQGEAPFHCQKETQGKETESSRYLLL